MEITTESIPCPSCHNRFDAGFAESLRRKGADDVTRGELIDMLIKQAKDFLKDEEWFVRNCHMLKGAENIELTKEQSKLTLVGFLNHAAACQGIDLAFYYRDFEEKEPTGE